VLILTPTSFSVTSATASGAALDWARSGNGQQLTEHGTCAAALLPADDDVVLVLPPHAVSWHRATLPRIANARLRAVLDGVLEEHLLSDSADLHFALEPGGRAGQTVWVAACHKAWLKAWLQVLEDAGRPVSRIVPSIWPHLASARHPSAATVHWAHHQAGRPWLASASALGVVCTPLQPGSAGAAALVLPTPGDTETPDGDTQWLAEPAAAAEAEQLLGQRFELVALPAWLLRCAQSEWNLAQFDLSLSSTARRGQRLRQTLRQWRSAPAWRPARWGLAALLVVQLVGLNTAAWQERRVLAAKQQALGQTLQRSFPQVTLVLDAPLQMRRELARLQQASGTLSHGDLEAMLGVLGQATDAPSTALSRIDFSNREGRFTVTPDNEDSLTALQQTLQRSGWQAQRQDTELTLRPANP
jgi:general secretion pathway protein L